MPDTSKRKNERNIQGSTHRFWPSQWKPVFSVGWAETELKLYKVYLSETIKG